MSSTHVLSSHYEVELHPAGTPDRLVRGTVPPAAPASDFYRRFYEGAADGLAATRRTQFRALLAWIDADLAALPEPLRLLDVGCGRGEWVALVARMRASSACWGVDPGLAESSGQLIACGLEQVGGEPALPESFHVLSLLDVLEHFEDPVDVLQRARTLLAPGGILLIKVPNKGALFYRLARALRLTRLGNRALSSLYQVAAPPPHWHYFDRASLTELLARAGARVERATYLSEVPVASSWSRLWMLHPAARLVVFPFALLYALLARGPYSDGLVVIARFAPR